MATINGIDELYSNIAPSLSVGESITLSGVSSLTFDASTISLGTITYNNVFRKIVIQNKSTTDIIIVDIASLSGDAGTLDWDGGFVDLPAADGVTPSITRNVPSDSFGNYPTYLGTVYNNTDVYTQVASFTDLYADHRGLHFTYNNTTGVITFGDGTNGKIPNGSLQICNSYVQVNSGQVRNSKGFWTGVGGVNLIEGNIQSNIQVNFTSGAKNVLSNPVNTSEINFPNTFAHTFADFTFLGDSSRRLRIRLGENNSSDSIIFQTENTQDTEVLQNHVTPLNGVIEARYVAQKTTLSSRTRLRNNGGSCTLKLYQGYGDILHIYGGQNGTFNIEWSTGYKTTDIPFNRLIFCSQDCKINIPSIVLNGALNWNGGERETLITAQTGELNIGTPSQQIVFPSGMNIDEYVNLSGDSRGTIDNILYQGTASSGTRDYNTSAPNGWRITNFKAPNDPSHGNQPVDNLTFKYCTFIGSDPALAKGVDSVLAITATDYTSGSYFFLPHTGEGGQLLVGSEPIYNNGRVYFQNIGDKVETESDLLSGNGIPTGAFLRGSLTSNFTVEYKIWQVGQQEPASYKAFNLTNIQTDCTGFTTTTRWFFKYTVEKTAGNVDQGYLTSIELEVPLDSNYVWQEPAPELPISAPNIIDDSRVVVINYTRSTKVIDQYGVERITVPSVIDNSVVSGGNGYSLDVRVGTGEDTQIGDVILFKINWQSGTQAKLPLRLFAVMTASGISLIDSQEDDEIHNNLIFNGITGLDGATVDSSQGGPLTANFTNIEINVNDADDSFDCRLGIPWWRWINTTEQGALIYDALGLVYKPDEYNIEIQGPLKIKNAKVASELTIINGIWKHYQGESIIADDSETVVWVPNDRLYNANSEQITDIKAVVDQYLDATISSRSTLTDQQVWEYSTRTLTSFGTLVQDVWNYTTRLLTGNVTVDSSSLHTALDSYSNKDSWKADTSLLALEATSQTLSGFLNDLLDRHDNECRFYGQDGITEVEQPDSYYMSLLNDAGTAEIKRISFRDSNNNPISLTNATRYIRV